MAAIEEISPETVPLHWWRCWPLIEPAVRRFDATLPMPAIFWDLRHGVRQLWRVVSDDGRIVLAAIVSELVGRDDPRGAVMRLCWVGGFAMDEWWPDAVAGLEAWARRQDCRAIEITGRRGWQRMGFDLRGKYEDTGLPILVRDLFQQATGEECAATALWPPSVPDNRKLAR